MGACLKDPRSPVLFQVLPPESMHCNICCCNTHCSIHCNIHCNTHYKTHCNAYCHTHQFDSPMPYQVFPPEMYALQHTLLQKLQLTLQLTLQHTPIDSPLLFQVFPPEIYTLHHTLQRQLHQCTTHRTTHQSDPTCGPRVYP